MWKYNIVILLFLLASCQSHDSNLLANKIEISSDSCCVRIKNIDAYVIKQLLDDSLTLAQWQTNIAIYKKAAEEDLQDLEKPLAGIYTVKQNDIFFKPTVAFKKEEYYLVAIYMQNPDDNLWSKLKSSNSLFHKRPIQKIIKF